MSASTMTGQVVHSPVVVDSPLAVAILFRAALMVDSDVLLCWSVNLATPSTVPLIVLLANGAHGPNATPTAPAARECSSELDRRLCRRPAVEQPVRSWKKLETASVGCRAQLNVPPKMCPSARFLRGPLAPTRAVVAKSTELVDFFHRRDLQQ